MAYEQPAGQPNLIGDDEEEDDFGKDEAYAREPAEKGFGGDQANRDDYKDGAEEKGEKPEPEVDTVSKIRDDFDELLNTTEHPPNLSTLYLNHFQNLFELSPGQRRFVGRKNTDMERFDQTLKMLKTWVEDEKTDPFDLSGAGSDQAHEFENNVPFLVMINDYLKEMVQQFEAPPPKKPKPPAKQTEEEFLDEFMNFIPENYNDIQFFSEFFHRNRHFRRIIKRYDQWSKTPPARRNHNYTQLFGPQRDKTPRVGILKVVHNVWSVFRQYELMPNNLRHAERTDNNSGINKRIRKVLKKTGDEQILKSFYKLRDSYQILTGIPDSPRSKSPKKRRQSEEKLDQSPKKPKAPGAPGVSVLHNANAGQPNMYLKITSHFYDEFRFMDSQVRYLGTPGWMEWKKYPEHTNAYKKFSEKAIKTPKGKLTLWEFWKEIDKQHLSERQAKELVGSKPEDEKKFQALYDSMQAFKTEWETANEREPTDFEYFHRMEHGIPEPKPKHEKHEVEAAKHKEAIDMFGGAQAGEELLKFVYSQQTAKVLLQANPQTKDLDKLLLHFDQMWFKYFPQGRISPADWVLTAADKIGIRTKEEIAKGKQTRRQEKLDNLMFVGKTRKRNTVYRSQWKDLYPYGTKFDALQRLVRHAQDRERYQNFLKKVRPQPPAKQKQKPQAHRIPDVQQLMDTADTWMSIKRNSS